MTRRRSIAAILVTLATVEALIVALLILPSLSDDPPATIQAIAEPTEVRNPTDSPIPRSERLAPYPTPLPTPADARLCAPKDLNGQIPGKFTKVLLNFGATNVYLLNQSPDICVIEGRPVLSGIGADGSEFPLTNEFGCFGGESYCAAHEVDERITLYPESVTDTRRPHSALIQIGLVGSMPDFCPDPIPVFPTIRVSWPQGAVDIHWEPSFGPCEAKIYLYGFQGSNPYWLLQDE